VPRDERDRIGERILHYLEDHPDAADTANGIRQWWLGEPEAAAAADVQTALDRLVEQKLIARIDREGMPSWYRSARRRNGGFTEPTTRR